MFNICRVLFCFRFDEVTGLERHKSCSFSTARGTSRSAPLVHHPKMIYQQVAQRPLVLLSRKHKTTLVLKKTRNFRGMHNPKRMLVEIEEK